MKKNSHTSDSPLLGPRDRLTIDQTQQSKYKANDLRGLQVAAPSSQNANNSQQDLKWSEIKIYGKNICRRSYHSAVYHEDRMYLYGGYEVNEGILGDFYEMMIQRNQVFQWKKVDLAQPAEGQQTPALTPGPLMRHTAVVYKDKMIVFGGNKQSLISTDALWEFDFNEDTWQIITPKSTINPPKIDSHSAAVDEDKQTMYIFGGFSNKKDGGYTNHLWKYNLESSEWSLIGGASSIQPIKRAGSAITVAENNIYMFGGVQGDTKFNDLWKFDVSSEQWTQFEFKEGDVLPETRNGHSLITYKGNLVLFGGIHDITHERNDLHVFDLQTKKWTIVDSNTSHSSQNEKNDENSHFDLHNQLANESGINNLNSPDNSHKKSFQGQLLKTSKSNKSLFGNTTTQHQSRSMFVPILSQQNESIISKEESIHPSNQMEEKKKRRQLMKKMNLLQEFELKDNEKVDLRPVSPTTETMKNSIASVGNPTGKAKFSLKALEGLQGRNQLGEQSYENPIGTNRMVGRRPCARDGHSSVLCENYCFIFGGDRHLMSYNDLFAVDLDKFIQGNISNPGNVADKKIESNASQVQQTGDKKKNEGSKENTNNGQNQQE